MEVPQEKLDAALEDLNGSLKLVEDKFIQERPFIAGDHISLADLVAIVEIMQVRRKVQILDLIEPIKDHAHVFHILDNLGAHKGNLKFPVSCHVTAMFVPPVGCYCHNYDICPWLKAFL